MSLCVCIQNNNELIIAADTAMTFNHKGTRYRLKGDFSKLVQVGRFLIFMSGSVGAALQVLEKFRSSPSSIEAFQKALMEGCQQFADAHPETYANLDDATKNVAALVAEWKGGKSIIHTIQPSDNYQIHTYEAEANHSIPHAGGVEAGTALEILDPLLRQGTIHAFDMIDHVYDRLAGAEIGGVRMMAIMNQTGIKFLPNRVIPEMCRLPVFNNEFSIVSNSASLYGAHIATKRTGYPNITLSATSNLMTAEYSANRKISIDPNNYLTDLFPHLRFTSDGYEAHIHHAGSAGLIVDANDTVFKSDVTIEWPNTLWVPTESAIGIGQRNLAKILSEDYVSAQDYNLKINELEARIRALENA